MERIARNSDYWNAQIISAAQEGEATAQLKPELATFIREGHPQDARFVLKEDKMTPNDNTNIGESRYQRLGYTPKVDFEVIERDVGIATSHTAFKSITDAPREHQKPGPKPVFKPYGRFLYDKKKFGNGSVLSLRFNDSSNRPYDFRVNRKLGPNLKSKFNALFNTNDNVDISDLELEEQTYIKHFQNRSRSDNRLVGGSLHKTLQDAAGRVQKIVGSISAGNDSKLLKNELNDHLNLLLKHNVFSKAQVAKYSEMFLED